MSVDVRVATATRAMNGQPVCGDAVRVWETETSFLVAIADGLGHGPDAAKAAQTGLEWIDGHQDLSPAELLRGCHKALRPTRGAVMSVLTLDRANGVVRHAGLGNIMIRYRGRGDLGLLSLPGVVGVRLRKVVEQQCRLNSRDLMILHSDGISSRFSLDSLPKGPPEAIAEWLIETQAKGHDDASCVVITA